MRKLLVLATILFAYASVQAQVRFNPQIGGTFVNLTNNAANVTSKAVLGFQLGADLRFGDRLYFQPGAYFGRNATALRMVSDSAVIEDNMIRTTAKVKTLLGYDLIHGEHFKLRVNAGPTYTVLLSADDKDDKIDIDTEDLNAGSFNMDAGVGLDLAFLTLEAGLSYGLSNAFRDQGQFLPDAKYFMWYATVGIVFPGGE